MNRGKSRKIPSVSELLAKWPDPLGPESGQGLTALDWDEAAETIQARIEAGSKADETGEISTYLTDEEIFSAPAGQTDKDGHNSGPVPHGDVRLQAGRVSPSAPVPAKNTSVATLPEESKMSLTHEQRERERKSLQDLARLAQMTPAPSSVRMPVAPVSVPASATPSRPTNDDVMIPSSRKEEDSGLVNFAAFSPQAAPSTPAAPSSQRDQVMGAAAAAPLSTPPARVSTPVSAPGSAGLFDDEPLSGRPPSVAPVHQVGSGHFQSAPPAFVATLPSGGVPQVTADSVRPPVSIAVPQSVHPQTQTTKKKGGAAIFAIGTVVALAAVAAGGFFVVRPMMQKRAQDAALAMNQAKVETKEAPAPVVPETRWQDSIAAKPAADPTPAPADDKGTDTASPAAEAKNDQKSVAVTAPPAFAKKPSAGTAPAKSDKNDKFVLNEEPKPAPAAPAPPPPVAKTAVPTSTGGDANLENAMKTAAGPSDTNAPVQTADEKKPQFAAGTVPQRPSQGAVTSAISSVLPNARACLSADDAVSRATITFASDGSVQSVAVRGGAAGKPAEQCIKGALSAAKVPPFAESTYVMPVTVRH